MLLLQVEWCTMDRLVRSIDPGASENCPTCTVASDEAYPPHLSDMGQKHFLLAADPRIHLYGP